MSYDHDSEIIIYWKEDAMAQFAMNSNCKESLHSDLAVVNGGVRAQRLIPVGKIIYTGYPMLRYVNVNQYTLIGYLLHIQKSELEVISNLVSNLYPRTFEEFEDVYSNINPGISRDNLLKGWDCPHTVICTKCRANKFTCEDNVCLIYRTGSMFNHSCYLNCININDEVTGRMTIITTREIQPGEECYICYYHSVIGVEKTAERRKILSLNTGFLCTCVCCSNDTKGVSALEFVNLSLATGRIGTCTVCKEWKLLSKCNRCKKVSYCSSECQRKDWCDHRSNYA